MSDDGVGPIKASVVPSPRRRFLSFRQLIMLAVAAVLLWSGMVSAGDVSFAAFSLPYLYFLSVSFPAPLSSGSTPAAPVFGRKNSILSVYVSVAALVGLVLPIGYISHGVLAGDKEGIEAAAPHVFLLACQVFMEGVTVSSRFSLPMRVFIPVFYNAKRLVTISEWLRSEMGKEEAVKDGTLMRVYVGRGLAVVNMCFWSFNLFGFLLPVYLPRAFKRYYDHQAKF